MTASFRQLALGAFGMVLLAGVALAAPTRPVLFSTGQAGVATDGPFTLLIALPLNNLGTQAAENLTVTAVSLTNATQLGPALPISLGTVPSQGGALLNVQFDRSALADRGTYRLNASGTYEVAGTQFGFAVSRNVTLPPPSPSSATLGTVTLQSTTVSGGGFPSHPPEIDNDVNKESPPIPTGTFVAGIPTPTGTAAMQPPVQITRAAVSAAGAVTFVTNARLGVTGAGVGCSGDAAAVCSEPSGASGGGVVFVTMNWSVAYSTNGGSTFTVLDPTTIFPSDAVGFCCDQIVQYLPSINRFVWLLQGNGYRLATASPADIINSGGKSWTYWNLTPAVFGEPASASFDYPDLSVGNNALYLSWDGNGGFQVARTSLAGIAAGGTISIDFTHPSDGPSNITWGDHLTQDTGDEIFWAGHNGNNKLRVFSLAEGSNTYFWRDIGISSWANNAPTSTTPDGVDWLAKNFNGPGGNSFPRNGVIGATRSGNQLWFAWSAGTDSNFKQPHIEMVTLDRGNNFSKMQQVQIWNNDYAFAYPALATNACTGEVGLSFEFGGNGNYENHVVGFWGDFIAYITTGSNSGTDRFGDYVTIRQAPVTESNPGNLFTAFGFGVNAVPPPGSGKQSDVRYVLFGRPASSCQIIR
jgi:hypothetical protein